MAVENFFSVAMIGRIIFKLIVVFGIVFLDYLIMLSVKDRLSKVNWKNNQRRQAALNIIWLVLIIINMLFLQELLMMTGADGSKLNGFWNNSDLQIMILFYFVYMLRERVIVYASLVISVAVFASNIWEGKIGTVFEVAASIGAIVLIFSCSWLINKHQKQWINRVVIYLLSEICFAASWGLLMLPTMTVAYQEFWAFAFDFVVIMLVIHTINFLVRIQLSHYDNLANDVYIDYLTGIGNRGAFDKAFEEAFTVFKNNNLPFTFAMFDIDKFKDFNDTYGHLLGDTVIKDVAQISKSTLDNLGTHGQIFRIGGEEFGILFRNKSSEVARKMMIEICKEISGHKIDYKGQTVQITVSVGISELRAEDERLQVLYERVDHYLYHSKENGRRAITTEGVLVRYNEC